MLQTTPRPSVDTAAVSTSQAEWSNSSRSPVWRSIASSCRVSLSWSVMTSIRPSDRQPTDRHVLHLALVCGDLDDLAGSLLEGQDILISVLNDPHHRQPTPIGRPRACYLPGRARDNQSLTPALRVDDRNVDVASLPGVRAHRDLSPVGRNGRMRQVMLDSIAVADRELFHATIAAARVHLPLLAAAPMSGAVEIPIIRPRQPVDRRTGDLERRP